MRVNNLYLVLFSLCLVTVSLAEPDLDQNWELFKIQYKKNYINQQDEANRRLIWEQNVKKILNHNLEYNLGKHGYFMGVNQFADLTSSEFSKLLQNPMNKRESRGQESATYLAPSMAGQLPDSVDWRTKGYVTPVQNQGECGATPYCTCGTLEGQHFRKTGKLIPLSEQNLIDCTFPNSTSCADGGATVVDYLKYVIKNKGIDTLASYPNEGNVGKCRFNPNTIGATATGVVFVSPTEADLKSAVATVGPISVYIDASQSSFQLYAGGIYEDPQCSSTLVDHCMLVVGYGTDATSNTDFWILKNTWGVNWGARGYIYMARNKNNMCGIADDAIYPTV